MLTFRKTNEEKQSQLNVHEVYTLWDLLKTKYNSVESLNVYKNFVHDIDFEKMLYIRLDVTLEEIKKLEELIKKYKIPAPSPYRAEINTSSNTEILTDKYIASKLLITEQELIEMVLRSFQSASTNDDIRNVIKHFINKEIEWLDRFIKYFKIKGWIDQPAFYPNIPLQSSEKIDCGEAYHLWDHLTYRYTNIEITEIFHILARDGDFKLMLKKGVQDILSKDAIILEKELKRFGISLPTKPKRIYDDLEQTSISDETMFKQVFANMQSATVVHAQALKQSNTNDRIRNLFSNLLLNEVDIINNVIKYGKVKGWLNEVPTFTSVK